MKHVFYHVCFGSSKHANLCDPHCWNGILIAREMETSKEWANPVWDFGMQNGSKMPNILAALQRILTTIYKLNI